MSNDSLTPEGLFARYFRIWYSRRDISRRSSESLYPDVIEGVKLRESAPYPSNLSSDDYFRARAAIQEYTQQAQSDFCTHVGLDVHRPLKAVQQLDEYFSQEEIRKVISRSAPNDDGNEFAVLCAELGAFVGAAALSINCNLDWFVDLPFWDSCILDQRRSRIAPVFHWAIKRLSCEGDDELLVPKLSWFLGGSSGSANL
jgi:hypothetical protein